VALRFVEMMHPATGELCLALVPRFASDLRNMRQRGYKAGDTVKSELRKIRDQAQWRRAHRLGQLVAENIEPFTGLDSHAAIKRLQAESGLCCDVITSKLPGYGTLTTHQPRSLAFDEMDEAEFTPFYSGLCRYIAQTYWPTLTPEQVAEQADMMPNHTP
jgi:hypothetical protein